MDDAVAAKYGRMQMAADVTEADLDRYKKSQYNRARGINYGFLAEKIAVLHKDFPWNPLDCKPLFDPVDFIVFDGLSKGKVTEVVFVDVKSGKSPLTKKQKQIKLLVEGGKVFST
jgi:predicted Holliday junction resolvase-like endonuclease